MLGDNLLVSRNYPYIKENLKLTHLLSDSKAEELISKLELECETFLKLRKDKYSIGNFQKTIIEELSKNRHKPEIDTAETIEEEYIDDETGEVYYEEESNQDYGCVDNIYDLDKLDKRYYDVNDEFIAFLNYFFTKELENNPSAYNTVKTAEIKKKVKKPRVQLVGLDGNCYSIIGRVRKTLIRAGLQDQVVDFIREATSGDYNNLLVVCSKYCDVY